MLDKQAQRNEIKALFKGLGPNELQKNSKKLSDNLYKFIFDELPKIINLPEKFLFGAFAPLRDEVIWHLAFDEKQDQASYPSIENGQMVFLKSRLDEQELRRDFGVEILCPPLTSSKIVPDLLIVPGRAFAMNGDRLGRGKGFYDKYLTNYKNITIGVCLEVQIKDEIVTRSYDQKVDYIVTEKRIIDTSAF